LQRNKDQLKASVLLNLDSPTSRMSALVAQETSFGRFFSPDQIIRRVEAVTAADIQRLANEMFQPRALAAIVVGALDGFRLKRAQLQC
jgi:predicted Zn-dependent peptidase